MRRLFHFRSSKKAAKQEDSENSKVKDSNRSSRKPGTVSGFLGPPGAGNGLGEKEREKAKGRSRQNDTVRTAAVVQEAEKKREVPWIQVERNPRLSNLPKHIEGEQVAAGWPAWLSAEAGEAIKGWIPRRADSFEKLDKIGQGTYSNVYKARDLDSGKIVALKKVRFDNAEPESVRFMAREIQILRRLDHPNIVKLEGLVTSRMSCSLYLVFEYMEHDLAGLAACSGIKFTEPQVKCFLQQILRGLDHCHSHGVLHRDIKGSNLLLDNGGILKMADFGLATFFHPDQKQPLTSRVVTLWYRPPELLLGATEYGAAVDLWSTGCILAELLAGKPIMPGRTEVEQLHKIFKLCGSPSEEYWKRSKLPHATIFKPQQPYKRCIAETFKEFPQSALSLLESLLAIETTERGTAAAALKSEFFTTKPYACDPSSLPKYAPSKEFDAKMRDEEARRQRAAAGSRSRAPDATRRQASREHASKAVPAPDANAELANSLQKRRLASHGMNSKSEKFNAQQDDPAAGFPIDPPRQLEGGGGSRIYAPPPAVGKSGVHSDANVAGIWDDKQKDDASMAPLWSLSRSTKTVTISDLKSQSGYDTHISGDLSGLSTLVPRNTSIGEVHRDINVMRQPDWAISDNVSQYSKHEVKESTREQRMDMQRSEMYAKDGLHRHNPVHQERPGIQGYGARAGRMHFSGPLLPPSANLEDIYREHEYQLQQAVRRARHEKGKNNRDGSSSQKLLANGDSSEIRTSYGSALTSNGRLKTGKAHFTGEIVELQSAGEGLSVVMENSEQEM